MQRTIPSIINVRINLTRRRLSIDLLRDNIRALTDITKVKEGGFNLGYRKEAVLLEFTGGRIIIYENGIISFRFNWQIPSHAASIIRDIVKGLFQIFGWNEEDEILRLDTDVVIEGKGKEPDSNLLRLMKAGILKSLVNGLEKNVHGVGYNIFLSPWEGKEDLKVRVEPLLTDPKSKYYIQVSHVSEEVKANMDFEKYLENLVQVGFKFLQNITQLGE